VITYPIRYNSILIDMSSLITPERAYEQYIANFPKREELNKQELERETNEDINKCLCEIDKQTLLGTPGVICVDFKHGQETVDGLRARGFNAVFISGGYRHIFINIDP
jgi:hypothetical protein